MSSLTLTPRSDDTPVETAPADAPVLPEDAARPAEEGGSLKLGERLLGAGLITPEELEAALQRQSKTQLRLGETLIDLGLVEAMVGLNIVLG